MTPETFIEQFETFAEAPNGVAKLRELILQLAVQGKLVPQDQNDEPSSKLLERIEIEKSQRAKAGTARFAKSLPPIDRTEKPAHWSVVRLGAFIELISGQHLTPQEYNENGEGHPYLTGPADFGARHPTATRWTREERALASEGDILITVKGAGIGKTNVLNTKSAFISRQLMAVRPVIVERDFVLLVLEAAYELFQSQGVGIAIPGIGRDDILNLSVSLPPLAEQRRIVVKVDQLLGLCDELASRQEARRAARERLVVATLNRLVNRKGRRWEGEAPAEPRSKNDSPSPRTARREPRPPVPHVPSAAAESASHAQRLQDHFDLLFDTPTTIPHLRQAILQLAVQGQLVPQDPNDEPAGELIKRARCSLPDLIDDDQMRRVEKLEAIESDDGPFALPSQWTWARFPELGRFGRGKSRHRPRDEPKLYTDGIYPLVQTGDVARSNGWVKTHTGKYNDFGLAQSRLWPVGTMCITIAANIADSGLLSFEACIPDSVVGFIPVPEIGDASYFEFFMRTAKSRIEDFAPSTAQKNINLGILDSVLIPIPPLAEQKRIVAKVTELLSLCDALETQLQSAESASTQLLSAAVVNLLQGS